VQHGTTTASGQGFPPAPVLLQSSLTEKPKLIEEICWYHILPEALDTINSNKKKNLSIPSKYAKFGIWTPFNPITIIFLTP